MRDETEGDTGRGRRSHKEETEGVTAHGRYRRSHKEETKGATWRDRRSHCGRDKVYH